MERNRVLTMTFDLLSGFILIVGMAFVLMTVISYAFIFVYNVIHALIKSEKRQQYNVKYAGLGLLPKNKTVSNIIIVLLLLIGTYGWAIHIKG